MTAIKITSKRQTVLPKPLCEELHVGPGDTLEVERREVDGESVWTIRPAARPVFSTFGTLRSYAKKPHDWDRIRESIDAAWARRT
mgnify:CR=1 FL=1